MTFSPKIHPEPANMNSQDQVTNRTTVDGATDRTKSSNVSDSEPNESTHLRRSLGFGSSLAVIVGTTIGSGIFVSPTGVLQMSGSVGLSLLIWLGCGVLSLLPGLCYIELGLLIPKAGGEFVYLHDGLGPLHPYWGLLPAFLFSWMANLVMRPASNAILALTFARYALAPIYGNDCSPPQFALTLVALSMIFLVAYISSVSISMTNLTQSVLTVSKLVALSVIVVAGTVKVAGGTVGHLSDGFKGSTSSPGDIATAFYRGLWAYDGWNTLNYLTEEVENPGTNLPRSIVVSMILITLVYLLVNMAYFVVLSPAQMLSSSAVAVTFADETLGWASFLVPLGVVLSVYGSLNGSIMASARICFSSARERQFPACMSLVHFKRQIPSPALVFQALMASFMIIASNIEQLIDLFSFAIWMFYFMSMVTLLVLRRTWANVERLYRVPTIIPIAMLLISMYLILAPIVSDPQIGYFYVILFMLFGVLSHYILIYRRFVPIDTTKLTILTQKIFQALPAEFKNDLK